MSIFCHHPDRKALIIACYESGNYPDSRPLLPREGKGKLPVTAPFRGASFSLTHGRQHAITYN